MAAKRFQNRIAESRWSLLNTSVVAAIIWALMIWQDRNIVYGLACLAVSTLMMVQLNNANSLIRIYSRMVSCSFIMMMTMLVFQYTSWKAGITTLCWILFMNFSFQCYQNKYRPGLIYFAFLCIGIASVFWIQILFFMPILWFVVTRNILAMSFKSFVASLLGIITPYWFLISYYVAINDIGTFVNHFLKLTEFQPLFHYTSLSLNQIITGILIILCGVIGTIHFLNKSSQDSIRTRLFYELFIVMECASLGFMVLQPLHYEYLIGMLIVTISPLIGHFIALTNTKLTNIATIVLIVMVLFITAFNIFLPSIKLQ